MLGRLMKFVFAAFLAIGLVSVLSILVLIVVTSL